MTLHRCIEQAISKLNGLKQKKKSQITKQIIANLNKKTNKQDAELEKRKVVIPLKR